MKVQKKNTKAYYIFFLLLLGIPVLIYLFVRGVQQNSQLFSNVSPTPTIKPLLSSTDYLSQEAYQQTDESLTKIVKDQDPTAALQQLTTLMNIDPKIYNSCHGLAHDIGHAAYDKYHDLATAFSYQDDVCGSGYVHGVIEKYFGNTKDIQTALYSVCHAYSGQIGAGNCYHGVGHGIMYFTGNNLPQSTYFCDTYTDLSARARCSEGVFMENFNSLVQFHPTKYLNPSNPFYPCPQQSVFHKSACYFYAPDYYLKLHERNFVEAIAWCQTAESGFVLTCINGVGSRTMKQNMGSPTFVEKICMKGHNQEQMNTCIDGMVSYYLVHYNSLERARIMCATLQQQNQQACYNAVTNRNTMFVE